MVSDVAVAGEHSFMTANPSAEQLDTTQRVQGVGSVLSGLMLGRKMTI